ncbi:hypothetical protein CAEBREN_23688 [Caenorhabditis brenneri]|uniref:Uncharacterized protein n=1 Tax=Caenorhabditis brenneri TaxID=135651 RepID=G0MBJ0_CAEBE|nr:hypothetical protein CAEBREN_23688 [Caenorhabditis brenneri]
MAGFSQYPSAPDDIRAAGPESPNSQGNPVHLPEGPLPENLARIEQMAQNRPIHLIVPARVFDQIRAHFLELGYEVVINDVPDN